MLHLLLGLTIMMNHLLLGQVEMEANQTNMILQFLVHTVANADELKIDLEIENLSNDPVTLQFSSSQKYEIIIEDENGNRVYTFSEGKAFLQVLQNLELQPGESKQWQETWDYQQAGKRVQDGKYQVNAELLAEVLKPHGAAIEKSATTSFQLTSDQSSLSNMKVEGRDGSYKVTGVHSSPNPLYYVVEDGHHLFIKETPIEKNQSFTVQIEVDKNNLPKNGTLIAYFYEKENGKMINTYPLLLEKF
ncbi:BsuPI-related putative proteinase inhibitor [Cytobacillus horneckiae]|uniref:BsuPI-related putative proteinase inhibitor n=1 Tax=Cytobacillus horneckiae TaxID=549687 RepID=UPI00399F10AC